VMIDTARELKQSVSRRLLAGVPTTLRRRAARLSFAARRLTEVDPVVRTVALGIAPTRKRTDFRLAVRIQRRGLETSAQLETIRRRARGEVDIRYIGRVGKQAQPWHRARKRPLIIGVSIGHHRITAGTLGAFVMVRRGGQVRVLSNNHVLADENRARAGDAIIQPGAFDGGKTSADRIGSLGTYVRLRKNRVNLVDAALASLDPGIDYEPTTLTGRGALAGVATDPVDVGEVVEKLGRTTGRTRGRITAFELDNVVVAYDTGNLRFDDQIEIEGAGAEAFSDGGDSGSLIFSARELRAVALLFAGGDQGGRNGKGLTYANPITQVLRSLKVELVS
jgi:hypothetical protein